MNIPQFVGLLGFTKKQLQSDFIAALVVTAIAIPESLGFAAIVGLPIQTGLYCALLAPVIFALVTSSRHLVVGADSATAALVASGAAGVAAMGTDGYVNAVAVLGIITGIVLVLMSIVRFGFLADLISRPVFIGFLAGIGIQLMISKLPEMLGIDTHGSTIHKLYMLATQFSELQLPTLLFSIAVFAIIILANRRKLPGSLIALIAAILTTYVTGLGHAGIEVVSNVPHGLPSLLVPHASWQMVTTLLPAAFAVAIIILVQSSSVIRSTAARFDEPVDDNRDLAALGLANVAAAFTHGFAINGSPPRTIAAEMSGGRTQFVNLFMALIVGAILLFLSSSLRYLPVAALAAVVFTIGMHLFDVRQLRRVWQSRRSEFVVALIALLGVALFGVQYGVAIAVATSIIDRLRRQYRPPDDVLLQDGQLAPWAENRIDPHHKHRSSPDGVLIYRFGGSLFFENSSYFTRRILHTIANAKQPVKCVIIDAGAISDIDFTASETIKQLCHKLNHDDVQICLAHVSPELQTLLEQYDLVDIIGKHNIYPSLEEAVFAYPTSRRSTIEMVQRLALPAHEYVVIGGGVMEALGLRDTNDVDIVVSSELYSAYTSKGWKEYIQDDGKHILSHHGYQLMETYVGKKLNDLFPRSFEKDGVRFMSVEDLIACKRKIGRQKDIDDIKLLNEHLAKRYNEAVGKS